MCTGNICRSPTAERLAAACGAGLGLQNFITSSAGTRAVISHPIHHEAARVLERLGGEASNFAARQFTPRIASDANLILTMTKTHRDIVLERAPQLLRRTFTLAEAACLCAEADAKTVADLAALRPLLASNDFPDVPDPIGQNSDAFERSGAQISELLAPILEFCVRSRL